MKILITGATGFVGSHVTKLIVNQGHEVHAIIREKANTWRIDDIISSIHIFHADLSNEFGKVEEYLNHLKPEICIHLAWYTEPQNYLNAKENLYSLQASINLLMHLAKIECRRFIGVGSFFEYDFTLGYYPESSRLKAESLYAATKIAFSTILSQFSTTSNMEIVWARLFCQYGPMEDERRLVAGTIVSLLKNELMKTTKGEQIRDFLHVEDTASALWSVACSSLTGEVNIGSGYPITIKEILNQISDLMEKYNLIDMGALPYRVTESMFICSDNRLLKEQTNWQQKYTLRTGLEHTINWYTKKYFKET